MTAMTFVSSSDLRSETDGAHLSVEGVWKTYNPRAEPVIRDVSFTLGQGEFMTLLGPSGSGKTTTLMMVAGFELPSRGRICVRGRDVSYLPPNRRDFGVVFQGYALFPQMSVLDNVEFALRMRRMDAGARRRKGLDMLDKVGLSAFAHRRPRELSGGQQQRVALARALAFEPEVLLLDEPMAALDKNMREVMQAEIKEIQRKTGVSVLLITHDQEEAMMMSDSVAVMESGRIVQIDAPEQIYNHPVNAFVATFLGETNLLPCDMLSADGETVHLRMAGDVHCMTRPGRADLGAERQVTLSLRPEAVRLLGPHEAADNVVPAEVVERVFLGKQIRYRLRALGQTIVAIGNSGGAGSGAAPGETVRIGWSQDASQILSTSA